MFHELVQIHTLECSPLPDTNEAGGLALTRLDPRCAALGRFFYLAIGGACHWEERQAWDRQAWTEHLRRADCPQWCVQVQGLPAGWLELQREEDSVRVCYLGLLPGFRGQGRGRVLVRAALAEARALGARRVWLYTSTLDDPRALHLYLQAGFRITRSVWEERALPDVAPGIWP